MEANASSSATAGAKVVLLRLSAGTTPGVRVAHYVDELSRKPAASPGVVAIRGLYVYPEGVPDSRPGTRARWLEFHTHCANGSFDLVNLIELDADARPLGAAQGSHRLPPVTKGSVGEAVLGIACKTADTTNRPRLTSTKAAIEDAMKRARTH